MVLVYNIYIFDKHCECIFYTEWNRHNSPLASQRPADARQSADAPRALVWPTNPTSTAHRPADRNPTERCPMHEEAKLVYGAVFSTRNIISKLNAQDTSLGGNPGGFMSFATNTYRLHYYEAPTGVKFVINTDVATTNMQPALEMIYRNIYVEYVVKNPLFHVDPKQSAPIENDYFRAVLNNYIREISSSTTLSSAL
ncbi:TRAPP complex subunit bet5 [Coemansia sp. RSA 2703]|nr:TRAPP complex subunit bet5 [Coemansia sp. RSA 2703]KAJ2361969.1 TRAPP complex subunit bet5 [Coemansia sp. RSA 2607]KAJ2386873.1 TRAPP complex subunit bet5 [Coemansia sp. RSA 2603]